MKVLIDVVWTENEDQGNSYALNVLKSGNVILCLNGAF